MFLLRSLSIICTQYLIHVICVLTQYCVFKIVKKIIMIMGEPSSGSIRVIVNKPYTGGYVLCIVRWIVLKRIAMIVMRSMVTKIDLHGYSLDKNRKNYSLSYCKYD